MNRYKYIKEEPNPIKLGLTFTSAAGHIATIMARIDEDNWKLTFTSPDGKKTQSNSTTDIIMKQIEWCKTSGNLVTMTYE